MSESSYTYNEPPHSVFSVLEEAIFNDPGDGLGPMDLLDGMLRRRIKDALLGKVDQLIHCIKLVADHEVAKYRARAWSSRSLRHASAVAEAPSIADVLVLLGIASERQDRTLWRSKGYKFIKIDDWAIGAANDRRGIPGTYDDLVEDWHDGGSREQRRIPVEFDL